MKRVVLMGYYGFNNAGDEAILSALVNNLKKDNVDVSILTSDIEFTSKKFSDVKCFDRKSDIFKALSYNDALIYGGGSIFQDVTSSKSLYYYLGIILLSFFKGKPVYIYSHGIGPINSKVNRFLFKVFMKLVKKISVRDKKSYDELIEMGIDSRKIDLISDTVFSLEPALDSRVDEILKSEEIFLSDDKKTIGISVRKCKEFSEDFLDSFSIICDKLIDECGFNLLFIPFQNPQDVQFSQSIIDNMKNKNDVKILRYEYLPEEIMGVMKKMYLNIGVRLHSLIFSAKLGIPFIGIDYDVKISGFLSDMGFEKKHKYGKIDWDSFKESLEEIFNNYDKLHIDLEEKSVVCKKLTEDGLQKIVDDI